MNRKNKATKEKSCGGVIFNDKYQVLIAYQENGVCAFPKGHMEKGESEIDTARREIFEETGLDVDIQPEPKFECKYHIEDQNIDKTNVMFICHYGGSKKPRPQTGEIKKLKWVRWEEVENKLQHKEWMLLWADVWEQMFAQSSTGGIEDFLARMMVENVRAKAEEMESRR